MRLYLSLLIAVFSAAALTKAAAGPAPHDHVISSSRAIVLVSGGAGNLPFITPTTCKNATTDFDVIREVLATYGLAVFVAPAHPGRNTTAPVPETDCVQVDKKAQINSITSVDDQGASLAQFLVLLRDSYNRTTFDLVAHSMGGLVSRRAIAVVKEKNLTGIKVASLTTLASPHQGSWAYDWLAGLLTDEQVVALVGDQVFREFTVGLKLFPDEGAGASLTTTFLNGPDGWNSRQSGVLDDVDVVLVGADALGGGNYLVHDGAVPLSSQLMLTPDGAVPSGAVRKVWNDVHSTFVLRPLGWPDDRTIIHDKNGSVAYLGERLAKLWDKSVVVTTSTTATSSKPSGAGKVKAMSLFIALLAWVFWLEVGLPL